MFTAPAQLRLNNALEISVAGERAIDAGERSFNLSLTSDVDSSAIAVLVGWQRYARPHKLAGLALDFTLSPNLTTLARLYEVHDLLTQAQQAEI